MEGVNSSGRRIEGLCRPAFFGPLLVALAAGLSFWLMDRGSPPNDEGALLTNAARILRGDVFYRDIDAYPFPAATYLLAGAMAAFGESIAVARALAALLFCGTVLSLYVASLTVLDARRSALFGVSLLSFKFVAWPAFTAYVYSDLSFFGVCLAVACFAGRPREGGASARMLLAGLGVGLSIVSKQNLGIYTAGLGGALILLPAIALGAPPPRWPVRWRAFGAFTLGVGLPVAAMALYFGAQGLLGQMLYSGLIRPFSGYLPTSGISFAEPLRWWALGGMRDMPAFPYFVSPYWVMLTRGELPDWDALWLVGEIFTRVFYTAVPVVFGLAALRGWRERRSGGEGAARRVELALFALAAILSAFPRADLFHIASVSPLLLLTLFGLAPAAASAVRRGIEVGAVAVATALSLGFLVHYDAQLGYRMTLDRAALWISPKAAWIESIVDYLQDELEPHEKLFVYGNEAYYYFFAARYDDWPFCQLYPGQAGGDGGRALADELSLDPPAAVVRGVVDWPGLPSLANHTPILARRLRAGYVRDDEVFARYPPAAGNAPPPSFVAVLRPIVKP